MERIVIFGAGRNGEDVFRWCKDRYEIIYFADNDKERWGREYLGVKIISPQELLEIDEVMIYVATKYEQEVMEQLLTLGINPDRIISCHIDASRVCLSDIHKSRNKEYRSERYKQELKTISIGKLLSTIGDGALNLDSLSFITGSSGVLDFALLKAIMLKYDLKTYLEIGTYIGESISVVSDVADRCYSITVPENHPYSMKNWCETYGMYDFSNRLLNKSNIIQFLEDSKEFDFSTILEKIDLYFIDADHSYEGVLNDTRKVFAHKNKNSIVIWHDFKRPPNQLRLEVIEGVEDCITKEDFSHIFVFDNNLCGIYIPDKYIDDFQEFCNYDEDVLYSYKLHYRIEQR